MIFWLKTKFPNHFLRYLDLSLKKTQLIFRRFHDKVEYYIDKSSAVKTIPAKCYSVSNTQPRSWFDLNESRGSSSRDMEFSRCLLKSFLLVEVSQISHSHLIIILCNYRALQNAQGANSNGLWRARLTLTLFRTAWIGLVENENFKIFWSLNYIF